MAAEPGTDASVVVSALFKHLSAGEWEAAAALFKPAFLEWFRSAVLAHSEPHAPPTVETYLKSDPEMPRVVAEYFVEQARRHPVPRFGPFSSGVESRDELESLDAQSLYARHLASRDPGAQFAVHMELLRKRHPQYGGQLAAAMQHRGDWWHFVIVGSVMEGRAPHVLVRSGPVAGGTKSPVSLPPEVVTLEATAEGWRIGHELGLYRHVGFGPVVVLGEDGQEVSLAP